MRAWGYSDNVREGYIRVNGQQKLYSTQPGPPDGPDAHTRGINLVTLDVATCTTSDVSNFDTYISEESSGQLVNYLNGLPVGTVLLGVTFDEPALLLTSAAKQALASIGVDVTGVNFRGKFEFIAVIGCPSKTLFKIAPVFGDNILLSAEVPGESILVCFLTTFDTTS